MQAAQSDRRRQRNDKKSANETISIITEWKDLNKWTPNTRREKEKKRKNEQEKNVALKTYYYLCMSCDLNSLPVNIVFPRSLQIYR